MSTMTLRMLSVEDIVKHNDELIALFDAACDSHDIVREEMQGQDVVDYGKVGMAAIFGGFLDDKLTCTFAIQFNYTGGRKGADLIAMAGKHLMKFKKAYWHIVLEWLKANDVQFLDAYTPADKAELYLKKFGFNKSCAYVRMELGGSHV